MDRGRMRVDPGKPFAPVGGHREFKLDELRRDAGQRRDDRPRDAPVRLARGDGVNPADPLQHAERLQSDEFRVAGTEPDTVKHSFFHTSSAK